MSLAESWELWTDTSRYDCYSCDLPQSPTTGLLVTCQGFSLKQQSRARKLELRGWAELSLNPGGASPAMREGHGWLSCKLTFTQSHVTAPTGSSICPDPLHTKRGRYLFLAAMEESLNMLGTCHPCE